MEINFSKGEYPIKQVIYCNMDSVTGALFMPLIKRKYGRVDIIHQIRESMPQGADLDLMMATTKPVVTTCWDAKRTRKIMTKYLSDRGWKKGDVRIYVLCSREHV
jgi:hypothetical protein